MEIKKSNKSHMVLFNALNYHLIFTSYFDLETCKVDCKRASSTISTPSKTSF